MIESFQTAGGPLTSLVETINDSFEYSYELIRAEPYQAFLAVSLVVLGIAAIVTVLQIALILAVELITLRLYPDGVPDTDDDAMLAQTPRLIDMKKDAEAELIDMQAASPQKGPKTPGTPGSAHMPMTPGSPDSRVSFQDPSRLSVTTPGGGDDAARKGQALVDRLDGIIRARKAGRRARCYGIPAMFNDWLDLAAKSGELIKDDARNVSTDLMKALDAAAKPNEGTTASAAKKDFIEQVKDFFVSASNTIVEVFCPATNELRDFGVALLKNAVSGPKATVPTKEVVPAYGGALIGTLAGAVLGLLLFGYEVILAYLRQFTDRQDRATVTLEVLEAVGLMFGTMVFASIGLAIGCTVDSFLLRREEQAEQEDKEKKSWSDVENNKKGGDESQTSPLISSPSMTPRISSSSAPLRVYFLVKGLWMCLWATPPFRFLSWIHQKYVDKTQIIFSIVHIFLYWADLLSDVKVMTDLFRSRYLGFACTSLFFLLLQYMVTTFAVTKYLEQAQKTFFKADWLKTFTFGYLISGYLVIGTLLLDMVMIIEPFLESITTAVRNYLMGFNKLLRVQNIPTSLTTDGLEKEKEKEDKKEGEPDDNEARDRLKGAVDAVIDGFGNKEGRRPIDEALRFARGAMDKSLVMDKDLAANDKRRTLLRGISDVWGIVTEKLHRKHSSTVNDVGDWHDHSKPTFGLGKVRDAGFTAIEVQKRFKYNLHELREGGFTVPDLIDGGFLKVGTLRWETPVVLDDPDEVARERLRSLELQKKGGFTPGMFHKQACFTLADLKEKAGFDVDNISADELLDEGGYQLYEMFKYGLDALKNEKYGTDEEKKQKWEKFKANMLKRMQGAVREEDLEADIDQFEKQIKLFETLRKNQEYNASHVFVKDMLKRYEPDTPAAVELWSLGVMNGNKDDLTTCLLEALKGRIRDEEKEQDEKERAASQAPASPPSSAQRGGGKGIFGGGKKGSTPPQTPEKKQERMVSRADEPPVAILKDAGFHAASLREAYQSAEHLKAVGFDAKELKDAGYTRGQCEKAGFTDEDLKACFNVEKKLEKMYLHELLITVKKADHATDLMGPDGKSGILEYGEVEVEGSNKGKCKQSMIIKKEEPQELSDIIQILGEFLPSYTRSRTLVEVTMEAMPQAILQAVVFYTLNVMANVAAPPPPPDGFLGDGFLGLGRRLDADAIIGIFMATDQERVEGETGVDVNALAWSLILSFLNVTMSWNQVLAEAQAAELKLYEQIWELIKLGSGLPLEAIKGNKISRWSVPKACSRNDMLNIFEAFKENSSLVELDLKKMSLFEIDDVADETGDGATSRASSAGGKSPSKMSPGGTARSGLSRASSAGSSKTLMGKTVSRTKVLSAFEESILSIVRKQVENNKTLLSQLRIESWEIPLDLFAFGSKDTDKGELHLNFGSSGPNDPPSEQQRWESTKKMCGSRQVPGGRFIPYTRNEEDGPAVREMDGMTPLDAHLVGLVLKLHANLQFGKWRLASVRLMDFAVPVAGPVGDYLGPGLTKNPEHVLKLNFGLDIDGVAGAAILQKTGTYSMDGIDSSGNPVLDTFGNRMQWTAHQHVLLRQQALHKGPHMLDVIMMASMLAKKGTLTSEEDENKKNATALVGESQSDFRCDSGALRGLDANLKQGILYGVPLRTLYAAAERFIDMKNQYQRLCKVEHFANIIIKDEAPPRVQFNHLCDLTGDARKQVLQLRLKELKDAIDEASIDPLRLDQLKKAQGGTTILTVKLKDASSRVPALPLASVSLASVSQKMEAAAGPKFNAVPEVHLELPVEVHDKLVLLNRVREAAYPDAKNENNWLKDQEDEMVRKAAKAEADAQAALVEYNKLDGMQKAMKATKDLKVLVDAEMERATAAVVAVDAKKKLIPVALQITDRLIEDVDGTEDGRKHYVQLFNQLFMIDASALKKALEHAERGTTDNKDIDWMESAWRSVRNHGLHQDRPDGLPKAVPVEAKLLDDEYMQLNWIEKTLKILECINKLVEEGEDTSKRRDPDPPYKKPSAGEGDVGSPNQRQKTADRRVRSLKTALTIGDTQKLTDVFADGKQMLYFDQDLEGLRSAIEDARSLYVDIKQKRDQAKADAESATDAGEKHSKEKEKERLSAKLEFTAQLVDALDDKMAWGEGLLNVFEAESGSLIDDSYVEKLETALEKATAKTIIETNDDGVSEERDRYNLEIVEEKLLTVAYDKLNQAKMLAALKDENKKAEALKDIYASTHTQTRKVSSGVYRKAIEAVETAAEKQKQTASPGETRFVSAQKALLAVKTPFYKMCVEREKLAKQMEAVNVKAFTFVCDESKANISNPFEHKELSDFVLDLDEMVTSMKQLVDSTQAITFPCNEKQMLDDAGKTIVSMSDAGLLPQVPEEEYADANGALDLARALSGVMLVMKTYARWKTYDYRSLLGGTGGKANDVLDSKGKSTGLWVEVGFDTRGQGAGERKDLDLEFLTAKLAVAEQVFEKQERKDYRLTEAADLKNRAEKVKAVRDAATVASGDVTDIVLTTLQDALNAARSNGIDEHDDADAYASLKLGSQYSGGRSIVYSALEMRDAAVALDDLNKILQDSGARVAQGALPQLLPFLRGGKLQTLKDAKAACDKSSSLLNFGKKSMVSMDLARATIPILEELKRLDDLVKQLKAAYQNRQAVNDSQERDVERQRDALKSKVAAKDLVEADRLLKRRELKLKLSAEQLYTSGQGMTPRVGGRLDRGVVGDEQLSNAITATQSLFDQAKEGLDDSSSTDRKWTNILNSARTAIAGAKRELDTRLGEMGNAEQQLKDVREELRQMKNERDALQRRLNQQGGP